MKHDHLTGGGGLEARPGADTICVWRLTDTKEGLLVCRLPHQVDAEVLQPRTIVGIEVSVAGREGGDRLGAVATRVAVAEVGPHGAVGIAERRDRLTDIRACLGHVDVPLVEVQQTFAFRSVTFEAETAGDLLLFLDASRQLASGAIDNGVEIGDRRGNRIILKRGNGGSDDDQHGYGEGALNRRARPYLETEGRASSRSAGRACRVAEVDPRNAVGARRAPFWV